MDEKCSSCRVENISLHEMHETLHGIVTVMATPNQTFVGQNVRAMVQYQRNREATDFP